MTAPRTWLTRIHKELKKTPLAANLIFSLFLAVMEKIAEVEFQCPCNPEYNSKFANAFFAIPFVLILLLMLIVQEWKRDCLLCCRNIFIMVFSVMVWLMLMFTDGQYYACSKTSWSGTVDLLDSHYPQKWCKPGDQNLTKEYMTKTREFFNYSQNVGITIAIVLTVLLGLYAIVSIWLSCKPNSKISKIHKSTSTQGLDQQDPAAILQRENVSIKMSIIGGKPVPFN